MLDDEKLQKTLDSILERIENISLQVEATESRIVLLQDSIDRLNKDSKVAQRSHSRSPRAQKFVAGDKVIISNPNKKSRLPKFVSLMQEEE